MKKCCCVRTILISILLALYCQGPGFSKDRASLRVACFSQDIPSIEPLSPSFDPDSYSVICQIFDSLIYLDLDGKLQPGLAISWEQRSPTTWHFTLRRGVVFHNGEPFDGHAVKFTYEYVTNPTNKAGNAWILETIKKVTVSKDNPFSVLIETHHPDGLFLNRFSMFGSICPPQYFKEVGLEGFARNPIGTGPYKFESWSRGRHLSLVRNPDYWQKGLPKIPRLRFVIMSDDRWLVEFLRGNIDFLPNLAGNQTSQLMRQARGEARILKRLVLAGYWALIRNRGYLADKRVRLALNFALNKEALVRYGDFGNARPLASLGKEGEFGANPELSPYAYDPERARQLMMEAGVKQDLHLRVIVADIAEPVARIMKGDFARVGVHLDLVVVPRAEWARRVVGYKIETGRPPDYDIAVNLVDNPLCNLAFHAGLFLDSKSPWSMLSHPEFDKRFEDSLKTSDRAIHRRRLENLDQFIHQEALMIFLTQKVITAAVQPYVNISKFGVNGHLDYQILTTAEFRQEQ